MTFLTLVVSLLVIILANRSWTRGIVSMLRVPNTALWWVAGGAATMLALVLFVPAAQGLFHFAPLRAGDMALSLGAGLICVMWFELLKLSKWRIGGQMTARSNGMRSPNEATVDQISRPRPAFDGFPRRGVLGSQHAQSYREGYSMKHSRLCVCLVTLAILFTATRGFSGQQDKERSAQPGARSEDRITREVRHELVMLPYYGVFDNLAYRVDGSTVTLMGQVTRPTLKSDAGNVVKGIEGVAKVDNQILVLPLSPMDDRSRLAVYRAIYGHPGLDRYALQAVPPIHIIVDNGKVTLEGVVSTQGDKDLANIRANGVSGVFSVVNNLRVEK